MTAERRYIEISRAIREAIAVRGYRPGNRIMTERQMAEEFAVPRSVVREAVMALELDGLVEVRKGSGIYLMRQENDAATAAAAEIGPFELLQARQVLESAVAAQAARMVTKADIVKMRDALALESQGIETDEGDYSGDRLFHHLIAEATQNSALVDLVDELWDKRAASPMWARLQTRIFDTSYRRRWLGDHQAILAALQQKNAEAAEQAMWRHLENVRTTLMELSDVDSPEFDGFIFSAAGG
ncbi:MAG: FCD domain-containing protein [Rhodobacteraceae bacterium]|nr:FCD domain-containing protein [Paracoccaceae bacterium]